MSTTTIAEIFSQFSANRICGAAGLSRAGTSCAMGSGGKGLAYRLLSKRQVGCSADHEAWRAAALACANGVLRTGRGRGVGAARARCDCCCYWQLLLLMILTFRLTALIVA